MLDEMPIIEREKSYRGQTHSEAGRGRDLYARAVIKRSRDVEAPDSTPNAFTRMSASSKPLREGMKH